MVRRFASLSLEDALRPRRAGEPVRMHVVAAVSEPAPDYEAMRRLVSGEDRHQDSTDVATTSKPAT